MKKQYLVRQNCELSLWVQADSEEEALKIAEETPTQDWEDEWSAFEIDEDESCRGCEVCND